MTPKQLDLFLYVFIKKLRKVIDRNSPLIELDTIQFIHDITTQIFFFKNESHHIFKQFQHTTLFHREDLKTIFTDKKYIFNNDYNKIDEFIKELILILNDSDNHYDITKTK